MTNQKKVIDLVKLYKPSVIIHLAAETDLDKCEKDPARAYLINTVGTYHVALAAREVGAKMVYVSTAGVFNGRKKGAYIEKDVPDPKNVYGHSKYLGEVVVKGIVEDYIIARVCWMFGGGRHKDKKFIPKIIAQLDKPKIWAINDNFGSPTFSKDLIGALKTLILRGSKGVFHLNNKGRASRYDVARKVVELCGRKNIVIPVGRTYFNLPAERVANEVMSSRLNITRPWREALKEYIETEWVGFIQNEKNS